MTIRHALLRFSTALAGLLMAPGIGAQPNATSTTDPDDFAYGLALRSDRSRPRPLETYLISAAVYRGVLRSDLGDMQVFNASDEPVPFAVRTLAPEPKPPKTIDLPVFPIYGPADAAAQTIPLSLVVKPDGSRVAVRAQAPPTATRVLKGYVLDARAAGLKSRTTAELELFWSGPETSFVARIDAEVSDDLNLWRPLFNDQSIAQLSHAGRTLIKRRVRVPFVADTYVRLTWRSKAPDGFELTRAQLILNSAPSPVKKRSVVVGGRASDDDPTLTFDLGGPIPVDQIEFRGLGFNVVADVVLSSAPAPKGRWTERYRGLIYRVEARGVPVESPPISVARSGDRYWKLSVDPKGGGLGRSVLEISASWVPQQLLFVPRGSGPFLLAFGSARATPAPFDAPALLSLSPSTAGELPAQTVYPGVRTDLGGPEVLRPAPKSPWKARILWAVLILGVAVVVAMSLQLVRQAGALPTDEPDPSTESQK